MTPLTSVVHYKYFIFLFQIDVNRRREEEITKLKNDLEAAENQHGDALDALKKKLAETQLLLEEAQDLAKKTKVKWVSIIISVISRSYRYHLR